MYLVAVISSRNLLNAIVKIKEISPSDPDNAGGGGGGGGGRIAFRGRFVSVFLLGNK